MLARQVEKLSHLLRVGTLARKNKNRARFWHVATLPRRHVDHADTHGTHSMRFNKLIIIY